MTLTQRLITIGMVVLGTILTRFLPFLLFPAGKPTPKYIQYLGRVLPAAVFGMLVIYCLKNVSVLSGSHGVPELLSILLVIGLHLWKRQMLLSIAGGRCAICCWCSLFFRDGMAQKYAGKGTWVQKKLRTKNSCMIRRKQVY